MYKLRVKKKKEKKLIGNKIRYYVDFVILICCFIIAINIHPTNISNNSINSKNSSTAQEKTKMIYIFHDYEGNEFIMNDTVHGTSNSWDYLFDDEIPNDLKGNDKKNEGSVSIGDLFDESNSNNGNNSQTGDDKTYESEGVKDNQVSIEDIMSDLGVSNSETDVESVDEVDTETVYENEKLIQKNDVDDNIMDIDAGDFDSEDDIYGDYIYIVREEEKADNNSLIIEKLDGDGNNVTSGNNDKSMDYKDSDYEKNTETIVNEKRITDDKSEMLIAKAFTFIDEGVVLPTLVSWNDLFFGESDQTLAYTDSNTSNGTTNNGYTNGNNSNSENKKSGITIIGEYADCMTPWGYKIKHGESVLAYEQMDNAPNICNIERRFCWKGKLSGTYTKQGCSINENYTYEQWGDTDTPTIKHGGESSSSAGEQGKNGNSSSASKGEFKGKTRQNADGTVSVKDDEIGGSFVFDRPNNTFTSFTGDDNIRPEDSEVELSSRPHRNCTTPRGEKVKDGQFVQAFKHKNGFSDIPCEAQFRLCTVGDLMGTFTESSCKTRDTSFIDWVYGSPTWQTYSEEKLELIKKQIKDDEKKYNKDRKKIGKLSNDDDFDDLLYILDENY